MDTGLPKRRVVLTAEEKERKTHGTLLRSLLQDDELDGSLVDVIRNLTELLEEYSEYDELTLEVDHCYDTFSLDLFGHKLESDEEHDKRIKGLLASKAEAIRKQEEDEKKLMRHLLKKWGKD
jgi:hypothetical protein